MGKRHTIRRLLILTLAAILALTSGMTIGCTADLPEDEQTVWFNSGNMDGYSWGYWLTFEDPNCPILWTPPDRLDEAQKFHGENVQKVYIPKGYLTMEDFANTHFPDGTPFNEKQKEQAMEAYNWGFYSGFLQGSNDCLEGKPDRYLP